MVARLLENEVAVAIQCIKEKRNFILEGGAGSGKTYSLISLINALYDENPEIKIACITYTNNAVAEIMSRVDNKNLWVSTIHEFIWMIIKQFQLEIKEIIVECINNPDNNNFSLPPDYEGDTISIEYFDKYKVEYDEYYSVRPNIDNIVKISHNHILIIACIMFERYKKISDIIKDFADCIFIDEYQDTSPYVAEILLTHLQKSKKENVIGFFGDSMQCIYDESVGDLSKYQLYKIAKTQNRRNPSRIIDLANKFRNDGIKQVPSKDSNAPNMEGGIVRPGNIYFFYGLINNKEYNITESILYKKWYLKNREQTKYLKLTHKLNAKECGFNTLFEIYSENNIIKLIKEIKVKVSKNTIDINDITLYSLAKVCNITTRNKPLLGIIENDSKLCPIFEKIKTIKSDNIMNWIIPKRESLLGYKYKGASSSYEASSSRDKILRRLDVLYEIMELYQNKEYNEFLKLTKFPILSRTDKDNLQTIMNNLLEGKNWTIGSILDYAEEKRLLGRDDDFILYKEKKGKLLWELIHDIPFSEFVNSISYLKNYSPLCTQHSVKGSEYDNVIVLLDNGKWYAYDFKTLFKKELNEDERTLRTRKLFYVCITRAKKNLLIYFPVEDNQLINDAKDIFGIDNVMHVTSLANDEITDI